MNYFPQLFLSYWDQPWVTSGELPINNQVERIVIAKAIHLRLRGGDARHVFSQFGLQDHDMLPKAFVTRICAFRCRSTLCFSGSVGRSVHRHFEREG